MRQHQIRQNRLVETYSSVLNKSLKVLLESAMSKLWAKNLVFAKDQKESRRNDADNREGFG